MGTQTNKQLSSIILFTTLSASVLSLPYDVGINIPASKPDYLPHADISEWKDNAFNTTSDYSITDSYSEKIQAIIDFSKNIIENSVDIESEFVDIVNKNFWDLI